jgi:glycosyltransferase involved in cell wall biosynthesis
MPNPLDWNVAIYCANEAARLQACLNSVATALGERRARITVIINGSRDGSLRIAQAAARSGAPIEIFEIAHADKANAINRFFYGLRSPARAYAGVDGSVTIGAGAFSAMEQRLASDPHAMAVSGYAINGRSMHRATAATLRVGGQLHGQLHALRPEFVDRIVARGVRLPIGLYRGDGLLGSMAAHNLDPRAEPWDNARVPGVAGASYEIASFSPWRPRDWRRQFRRTIRQNRGLIENAAIKSIIYEGGYEALPAFADDMMRDYLTARAAPRVGAADRLFQYLALREIARSERPPDHRLVAVRRQ